MYGDLKIGYQEGKPEKLRQITVEKMWLLYFNRMLFEKGRITERMFRIMEIDIIINAEKKKKEVQQC